MRALVFKFEQVKNFQLVIWQGQTRKRSRNLTSAEKGKTWFSHRCGANLPTRFRRRCFCEKSFRRGNQQVNTPRECIGGRGYVNAPNPRHQDADVWPFGVVNSLDKALVGNNLDAEKVVVVVDRQFHQRAKLRGRWVRQFSSWIDLVLRTRPDQSMWICYTDLVVRLLSSTAVVSTTDVLPFQVVSRFPPPTCSTNSTTSASFPMEFYL